MEFKSNKIKLFQEGAYYKKLSILIEKSKKYLFYGEAGIGKTNLAEVLGGRVKFNINGWLVKVDRGRFSYKDWIKRFRESYAISPYFHSEKTLGEIIFGKDKKEITNKDLLLIQKVSSINQTLLRVTSKKKFIGESIRSFQTNNVLLFAIHILHCLITKPSIVIIDNHWADLNYSEINELIALLSIELSESTIIIFSRENNDIISYSKKYEIEKNQIKDIQ